MTEHLPRAADPDDTGRPAGLPDAVEGSSPALPPESPAAQPPIHHAAPDELTTQNDLAADGSGSAEADEVTDEHGENVRHWREKSAKRKKAKRPFWIELPILLVVAFTLTFLIQTFIAKVYYVPSGSMEQTLHGVESGGDRILANKMVYNFRDPARGDVVVFSGPPTWAVEATIPGPSNWFGKAMQAVGSVVGIAPPNEKDFVKRVIGIGGDVVECCDATGNVMVNGGSLNEPYLYEPWEFVPGQLDCQTESVSQRCFGPVTVPAGELWMMGDHRSESADSTQGCQGNDLVEYCQGPVPVDNVIGKAIFIIMPPSRWGTIGDPDIGPHNAAMASGTAVVVPAAGGLVGALVLRGGWALTPGSRRRRRDRRDAVARERRVASAHRLETETP